MLGRADHIKEMHQEDLILSISLCIIEKESRAHAVSCITIKLPAEEITLFENKSFWSCSSIESTCAC